MPSLPGTPPTQTPATVVVDTFKKQMRWMWIHYGIWMALAFLVYGPPRVLPEAYLDLFLGACVLSSAVATFLFYKCPACSRSLVGTVMALTCPRCQAVLLATRR